MIATLAYKKSQTRAVILNVVQLDYRWSI